MELYDLLEDFNRRKSGLFDEDGEHYTGVLISKSEVELMGKIIEIYQKLKIVVWMDGSTALIDDGNSWEYENDPNWLTTIEVGLDYDTAL